MIRDFFEWYENCDTNKRFDSLDLSSNTFFVSGISKITKGIITYEDVDYCIKTPHSRFYKFGYLNLCLEERDNKLATSSELISKKRYKQFRFMYANHRPLLRDNIDAMSKGLSDDILWKNRHIYNFEEMYKKGIYLLISPAISNEKIDTISLGDIATIGLQLTKGNKLEQTMYDSLEAVLDCKEYYLKFMTEECYDQYIKLVIASIFDFGDDDHFHNVKLCKNKTSDKYESIFIFDKESTAFNPIIAQNYDMELYRVEQEVQFFKNYNSIPIISSNETSMMRMYGITRLILNGKLEKRYVKFLEEIAGVDFNKIGQEIYEELGIRPNQKQLDVYKYGADLAGIISGKEY